MGVFLAFHPSTKSVFISNNNTKALEVRRKFYLVYNASYLNLDFLLNLNLSHVIKLSFEENNLSLRGSYNNCVSVKWGIYTCDPCIVFKLYYFIGFLFCFGPDTKLPIFSSSYKVLFV